MEEAEIGFCHAIVVDWCVLKADESLHLLRAALPVGGRALPV